MDGGAFGHAVDHDTRRARRVVRRLLRDDQDVVEERREPGGLELQERGGAVRKRSLRPSHAPRRAAGQNRRRHRDLHLPDASIARGHDLGHRSGRGRASRVDRVVGTVRPTLRGRAADRARHASPPRRGPGQRGRASERRDPLLLPCRLPTPRGRTRPGPPGGRRRRRGRRLFAGLRGRWGAHAVDRVVGQPAFALAAPPLRRSGNLLQARRLRTRWRSPRPSRVRRSGPGPATQTASGPSSSGPRSS